MVWCLIGARERGQLCQTHLPPVLLPALCCLAAGGSFQRTRRRRRASPQTGLCGEIRATQIKITDIADSINFLGLLLTLGSLWLCFCAAPPSGSEKSKHPLSLDKNAVTDRGCADKQEYISCAARCRFPIQIP